MSARNIVLIIFLSVLGIFFITQKPPPPESLCDNLRCISIDKRQLYTRKELYADTPQAYRALYSSPTHTLRIEVTKITDEQSNKELTAAITRLKALYEKAPAPYPGEISDAIICDPEYIPSFREATSTGKVRLSYFTGYLNNRLTFGSCSADQAVNKGILAYMYCPTNTLLIKLELIQPTAVFEDAPLETEKQLFSITCGS